LGPGTHWSRPIACHSSTREPCRRRKTALPVRTGRTRPGNTRGRPPSTGSRRSTLR
jgi:hypothetical protein